jgi:hypothetical protein
MPVTSRGSMLYLMTIRFDLRAKQLTPTKCEEKARLS